MRTFVISLLATGGVLLFLKWLESTEGQAAGVSLTSAAAPSSTFGTVADLEGELEFGVGTIGGQVVDFGEAISKQVQAAVAISSDPIPIRGAGA